ncbi:MAG: alpha/beta hydrolase [Ruminococcaceae bacterium]|nr:alpha/beta hydrolase [Oscillospiraceae bacterium]
MLCESIFLRENEGDKNVRLDTYVSKQYGDMADIAPRDCMLILPGGAYYGHAERESEPVAKAFMARGFNCFVLYYSVGEENARFPRPLKDVSMAIAHIRRNAERYNIDPERIFLCGFSAGGHLAASAGVFWNQDIAAFEGMEKGENRPAGMVLCYAVSTLGEFSHDICVRLVTGKGDPTPEERAVYSPDRHIDSDTVPAFIWHTASDGDVKVQNALIMAKALVEKGIPTELHVYPFGPHGMSVATEETRCNIPENVNPHVAHWVDDCCEWTKLIFADTSK